MSFNFFDKDKAGKAQWHFPKENENNARGYDLNEDDIQSDVLGIELLHHLLASDESPCGAKCTADGVVAYIDANPTAALTSDALAEHFGYHKNYLNRLVKEHTGLTLSGCIRRSRISYAMAQMAETGAAPSELAAELGYYDYSHFYKAFVAECGCTPGEFCRSE